MIIKKIYFLFFGVLFLCPESGFAQKDKNLKSVNTGLEFPCAPEVLLKQFTDRQLELNNLPAPVPDFKEWQIVVGRYFEFKAMPKNKSQNWQWKVGDDGTGNSYWTFEPPLNNAPDYDRRKGISKIPDSNLPASNDSFGPAQGQVIVSADIDGGGTSTDEHEVKVYFKKDDIHPVSGTPNWFHYWSQVVEDELTTSGIKLFEVNAPEFTEANLQPGDPEPITFTLNYRDDGEYCYPAHGTNSITYAQNNLGNQMVKFKKNSVKGGTCPDDPADGSGLHKVITGYPDDLENHAEIDIGKGCGFENKMYNYGPGPLSFNPPVSFDMIKGVDVFYALIQHEITHWTISEEFWSQTGYDDNNDCDGDYYPDDWEMGPVGMSYGFEVGRDDNYTGNYDPENLPNLPDEFKAATWFQEEKCRRKEVSTNPNSPHDKDWSFDPTYKHQGKKW
jgi:hypothetical protein